VSVPRFPPGQPGRALAPVATTVAAAAVLAATATLALAAPGVPATFPGPADGDTGPTTGPGIVAVYPNPVPDGDRGEFVSLERDASSNYRLIEGDGTVHPVPAGDGPVTLTDAPGRTGALDRIDGRTVRADLSLANGGERLRLVDDRNRTVSVAHYRTAPESEVYVRTDGATGTPGRNRDRASRWRWRPLGATDFDVATGGPANVTAFVLPDAPEVPIETLRTADRRILLAGYTFASERVATTLVRAAERGVRVRVLLEGAPVGGLSRRQARLLDRLVDGGVDVRVLEGPHDRYAYHHPKYAVVDRRALVLTENWKPAGTGGASSRGWGAIVRDPTLASSLAEVFRADAGWRDAVAWERFRRGRRFEPSRTATGSFPRRFRPERIRVAAARLLVTPDNAGPALVDLIDGADASVRVVGPTLDPDARPTRALVRAARRGVRVRVLLSSARYVREENRRVADRLNGVADEKGLPLTVRLSPEAADGFRKVHAKGVVVDGERAVVGSLNWNEQSVRENREVLLVLEGEEAADYYARVFDADWRGRPRWPVPPAAIAAAGVAVLGALAALRRIEFGGEGGVPPGPERW